MSADKCPQCGRFAAHGTTDAERLPLYTTGWNDGIEALVRYVTGRWSDEHWVKRDILDAAAKLKR